MSQPQNFSLEPQVFNLVDFAFPYILHRNKLYEANEDGLEEVDALLMNADDLNKLINSLSREHSVKFGNDYEIKNMFPHYFFVAGIDSMGAPELRVYGSNTPALTGDEKRLCTLDHYDVEAMREAIDPQSMNVSEIKDFIEYTMNRIPFRPGATLELIND